MARNWLITVNNPVGPMEQYYDEDTMHYLCGQLEIGQNGTPHYQMYVEFKVPFKLLRVTNVFPRCHAEVRRGKRKQARKYCMKEETRQDGPWEFGIWREQGFRQDLVDIKTLIMNGMDPWKYDEFLPICARYPKFVERMQSMVMREKAIKRRKEGGRPCVMCLYGTTGTGKTRWVYDTFGDENIYKPSEGDGSRGSLWWDDYRGQRVCLFDEFYGQIPFHYMLHIMDRYDTRVQTKHGWTYLFSSYIVFTSNTAPPWYTAGNIPQQSIDAFMRRFDRVFNWDDEQSRTLVMQLVARN